MTTKTQFITDAHSLSARVPQYLGQMLVISKNPLIKKSIGENLEEELGGAGVPHFTLLDNGIRTMKIVPEDLPVSNEARELHHKIRGYLNADAADDATVMAVLSIIEETSDDFQGFLKEAIESHLFGKNMPKKLQDYFNLHTELTQSYSGPGLIARLKRRVRDANDMQKMEEIEKDLSETFKKWVARYA